MRDSVLLRPQEFSFDFRFSERRSGAFDSRRIVLLLACIALAGVLAAQTFFGSIVGTITDSSGASVAGAKVALTNTATGERRAGASGADGNYHFVNLIPGLYRLDVGLWGESRNLQFRIEAQNLLNHMNAGQPDGGLSNRTFGMITSQSGPPRRVMGALKLSF
jgi:hypothetical protein